jgi:DNA-binding transcriptional LysR family regulator
MESLFGFSDKRESMRYTLRQLEVFLSVARFESVSRAAEELGMSQSAASGSLSDLESQFGVQLFDRVGKRLVLSELGRAVRPGAEALEGQARELETRLANQSGIGPIRVGATLSVGNYVTPPLLARFLERHPGAKVGVEIANTAEIARKVKNFELDLGLIEGELEDPELELTSFREDELCVFCAPGHPFAERRTLGERQLLAAAWIVREAGSGTRQAFERSMHGILPDLRIVLELQQTEAIKNAVKAGLGVGCVSRIALDEEFRFGTLIPCRVPNRDFRRQFYVVLRRDKYRSPAVREWIALAEGA